MLTRRGFLKLAAQAWLTALALAGYSTGVEAMGNPRTTRYAFTPPRWTPGLKLRIVVLADFHACEPWMSAERMAAICAEANTLGADLILLLGDYATSMKLITATVPIEKTAEILNTLKAPLGVHAVLGNHDYWTDDRWQADPTGMTVVEKGLRDANIKLYINETIRLEKDGHPFWLAGLGDQIALRPDPELHRWSALGVEDMNAILEPLVDDAPVLLMAHEPYIFNIVPERINLTISGHTHGGQVNLFGWQPFLRSPPDSRYVAGHIVQNDNHLVISRGLGCSGVPMRLGAWPEIVVLELG